MRLVTIVISMLIILALAVFYLRSSVPSGEETGGMKGAIERTRDEAARVEELQRERLRQLEPQSGP